AKDITIVTHNGNSHNYFDTILQRCISHYRGLYLTACLEFLNKHVINSYHTSEICGNKMLTSLYLKKNNVPTPKTYFAFSAEAANELASKIGYPLVLKPLIGSWGRMVVPIRDQESMEFMIEVREEDQNPLNRIYYLQEFVNRPPRDIRAIVVGEQVITAIYRYAASGEWRTNIARGGKAEVCNITNELEDICIKAAKAVGGGVLGVDLMEDIKNGLVVHEINNTVEFKGAASVSNKDIAASIIEYAIKSERR
ncbi:MAG: lysine biosynthesis protein LysX, partial [Candidatus Nitrosocaldaceae archaeon]